MISTAISATHRGATAKAVVVLPTSLDEAKQTYGEEVCFHYLNKAFRQAAQNDLRASIVDGAPPIGSNWVPVRKQRGKTTLDKVRALTANLSDEERASLRAEFGS